MSSTQVRAAEILLKKSLPDLQNMAVTTEDEDGNQLPVKINVTFKHVGND